MKRQSVQILTLFIILMFGVTIGCTDDRKNAQEKKPVAQQEEVRSLSAADQKKFRGKITGLGIPMYKGAEFVEVKRKAKNSPLFAVIYEIPAQGQRDYQKVRAYYAAGLKKALVPKGWAEGKGAGHIILYRKGFEIFFAEFSRIIIPPDKEKIRVAFHFGG
jgi:hypothetical protein